MADFRTIHTNAGLAMMASAQAQGAQIDLTHIAIGDGNGNPTVPDPGQTVLVRERFRSEISRVFKPDAVNYPTMFAAEIVIPATEGGFTMREVGVFDVNGTLFAVGNLPETYKPAEGDGAFSDTIIRVQFLVSNDEMLNITIDPSVIVATRAWVQNTITIGFLLPGGTTGQILKKISNADGDADWRDPGETNVMVSSIEERQALADGQTQVDLAILTTTGLAVYVNGERVPRGSATDEWEADPTILTRFFLGQPYTAGDTLLCVQNDPTSNYPRPLEWAKNFSDLDNKPLARTNLGVYSKAEVDQRAPPGMIADFYMAAAPVGWLVANGAAVSRTAYSALFSAIGTLAGPGDGVNTFNLPDFRGEFRRGWSGARGVDIGRALGSAQTDAVKDHFHGVGKFSSPTGDGSDDAQLTLRNWSAAAESLSAQTTHGDLQKPRIGVISGGSSTDLGTSRQVELPAGETRPRNIAVLTCIKY